MPENNQYPRELGRYGVLPFKLSDGGREVQVKGWLRFWRAISKELKSGIGLPPGTRLKAWRNGFSSLAWFLCDLDRNDPSRYLPDISARRKLFRVNGLYNPIIDNKLIFSRLAELHGVPMPRVHGMIVRGTVYPAGETETRESASILPELLAHHARLVFKPTWSGGGQGIFFLEQTKGRLELNGHEVTLDELAHLVSRLDRYIVTEYIEQADYARAIFPGATNTMRILTLWDFSKNRPFVAAVAHRFGSERSGRLDNWHAGKGGFNASVNVENATLGRAAWVPEGRELTWCASHPDSGAPIEGVVVPRLSACLEGIRKAAGHFPFCPLIGWDVALTGDGFCVLEANPEPAYIVWQVHRPLFADERNRAFFQYWGICNETTD